MRFVAVVLAVALLGATVCGATTFQGSIQTLDGKWRKARIDVDGGVVTVLTKGRGLKSGPAVPMEFRPKAVQHFVTSKRTWLSGLIVGAVATGGTYLLMRMLRVRLDDAFSGRKDRDQADRIFNALRTTLYAFSGGGAVLKLFGKSYKQFVDIETADGRAATLRVPMSQFNEFRQLLDGALVANHSDED